MSVKNPTNVQLYTEVEQSAKTKHKEIPCYLCIGYMYLDEYTTE